MINFELTNGIMPMPSVCVSQNMIHLRDYSSAFSRSTLMDVLNFDDYSRLNWLVSHYEFNDCFSYSDLLRALYSKICSEYRCEYVYKNELIKLLLKKFGTKNTVYFSEFRVGKSIADIAMFNGESKAFEIKTEYDSSKRLEKQMEDYKRLFDKCYLVVPEARLNDYIDRVEPTLGIIVMSGNKGHINLKEIRHAQQNPIFDPDVMISCLRTSEYTNIVSSLDFDLDKISGFDMFSYCKSVFSTASHEKLKELFLIEIKKRNNNTDKLRNYPMPLRQMILSLNLSENKTNILIDKLNINIHS